MRVRLPTIGIFPPSLPDNMKSVLSLCVLVGVSAFTTAPQGRSALTVANVYIPDGFTPESYAKFKEDEKKKTAKQNLGRLGPRGFQSRSMQSFQEALERGEAAHLMPVFNAAAKIKRGEIRREDVPYMQRGGSWDNSDVQGAKNRKRWLESDKKYANGGFQKEQSVSIFGYGEGLDWAGKKARQGPAENVMGAAPKFAKNYKPPNVYQMKGVKVDDEPKMKMFGLF